MKRTLYHWHRRIAMVVLLPLLLWAMSGLLHPLMRLTQPEIAQHHYPLPVWPANLAGPWKSELQTIAGVRAVNVGGSWWQQQWQDRHTPASFVDLKTGVPRPDVAKQYATQLARHFSGDTTSAIRQIRFIDRFNDDYAPINRLLPVWEVSFYRADALKVYVDIRQDRLATVSDNTRRTLQTLFQTLHLWSFWDANAHLRNAVFMAMTTGLLFIGASGLYLFTVLPLRNSTLNNSRKLHIWGGTLLSLILLMFASSGLMRTLEKQLPEMRGVMLNSQPNLGEVTVNFAQLQQHLPDMTNAILHHLDRQPVWQVSRSGKPDEWISAVTGQRIPGGETAFAHALAAAAIGVLPNTSDIQRIENFRTSDDYGFIDKRLPVIALHYPERSLYLDTRDEVLSKQTDTASRLFNWVFRYLHKWRFADGLGLNTRDGLMALTLLLLSMIAMLGGSLWLKRQRARTRSTSE